MVPKTHKHYVFDIGYLVNRLMPYLKYPIKKPLIERYLSIIVADLLHGEPMNLVMLYKDLMEAMLPEYGHDHALQLTNQLYTDLSTLLNEHQFNTTYDDRYSCVFSLKDLNYTYFLIIEILDFNEMLKQ